MMRKVKAFTLVELLVVISIMAILMGFGLTATDAMFNASKVEADAKKLEATLLKARALALRTGLVYSVTFNITNPGDATSGECLQMSNDEAGHWYAIIGPRAGTTSPPSIFDDTYNVSSYSDFKDAVKDAQVGPKVTLNYGVRFLALSDVDASAGTAGSQIPWFGYYSGTSLTAWGKFGGTSTSAGFNRKKMVDSTGNADVPLFDGYALDFAIYFFPDGSAMGPGNVNRDGTYKSISKFTRTGTGADPINKYSIDDSNDSLLCPARYEQDWFASYYWDSGTTPHAPNDVEHTGGYTITIAKDEVDDVGSNSYDSESKWRDSFLPFVRLTVNANNGMVEYKPPSHADSQIKAGERNPHEKLNRDGGGVDWDWNY